MEKVNYNKPRIIYNQLKRKNTTYIVVTGAESTGKTILTSSLAKHYKSLWVPEYARIYIESLKYHYTYIDVENIAKKQIGNYNEIPANEKIVFLDTWLIITKVWFREVFGRYPKWLDEAILKLPVDLYLICNTDIEWEYDPVRENGERRDYLMNEYIKEIELTGTPYVIISGKNKSRIENAISEVEKFNMNHAKEHT